MKTKLERLESQNSVLKEKSSDIRSENDRLVAKIQKLQSRISQEVCWIVSFFKYERVLQSQIRVSVSEFEDGDPDDIFTFGSSPTQSRSPESRIKVFVREGYFNMRLFGTKKILMSQPEALLEEEFSGTAALVGSIFHFSTEHGEGE